MQQASLFRHTPKAPLLYAGTVAEARATSHAAAAANAGSGRRESNCARLLRLYQAVGHAGVTDKEVAARLGMPHHAVPARRKDLAFHGIVIEVTGERRDGCCCWRLQLPAR
jgi:hypothetical protein